MQWMEVICDFFEKVRNLVLWEDPAMTSLFFALLVVLFIVVTFLPLRFIIFVAFIYKFICGLKWQSTRQTNNQEVCRLELLHVLEDNKLSGAVTDFDASWDSQIKRKMSRSALEERLNTHFQEVVKIFLPKDILKLCETPNQLIEYVGQTSTLIRLPLVDRNEVVYMKNKKVKKKSTPLHYHLHNFIMSRIPTDIYRVRNPSLGLERDADTGTLFVTEKKSKRLTEVVKFNNINQQLPNVEDRQGHSQGKSASGAQ